MRHDFLDRYGRLESPIHRLPAWVKLAAAISVVGVLVLFPVSIPLHAGIAAGLLAVAAASSLPPGFLARRLLFLLPVVLGVSAMALLQKDGLRIAGSIFLRSTLCLAAMILLSSTTPFEEILRVLRRVGTPALMVTTLALMYRYVFVLVSEFQRMRRARASRTFTRRRAHLWTGQAAVLSRLFVRSTERAERIYAAMCARGWK